MTVTEVLAELAVRGVTLTPEGDMVRYRGPMGAMSPDLKERVAHHKADLLALLRPRQHENPGYPDLAAAYRRYWTLQETEPMETFRAAYMEIARLEAQANPAVAWYTLRQAATAYHAERGICPFCRVPGALHLPAEHPEQELHHG